MNGASGSAATHTVSCIIPAYNEAPRISAVLDAVAGHPLLHEILVVDDGSTDGTREIVAARDGVLLIPLKENGGKSAAVAEGVRFATGDHIFLLDADLTGLSAEAITSLIRPVIAGKADISISLRRNTPGFWRLIGLDFISGERVFSKAFIAPMLGGLAALDGFGLEVFLNRHLIRQKLSIAIVDWPKVDSALKHVDGQAWYYFGIKKDFIRMAFIVLKTIPPWEAAWQIIRMLWSRKVYRWHNFTENILIQQER